MEAGARTSRGVADRQGACMPINAILRALVSLAGLVAAAVFLLRDQLLYALLALACIYLLNGVLASMAFSHPDEPDQR